MSYSGLLPPPLRLGLLLDLDLLVLLIRARGSARGASASRPTPGPAGPCAPGPRGASRSPSRRRARRGDSAAASSLAFVALPRAARCQVHRRMRRPAPRRRPRRGAARAPPRPSPSPPLLSSARPRPPRPSRPGRGEVELLLAGAVGLPDGAGELLLGGALLPDLLLDLRRELGLLGLLGFLLGLGRSWDSGRSSAGSAAGSGGRTTAGAGSGGSAPASARGCARTTTPFLQARRRRSGTSRASRAAPAFAVKPSRRRTRRRAAAPRSPSRRRRPRSAGTPAPQHAYFPGARGHRKFLRPRVVATILHVRGAEPLVADRAPENMRRGPHGPVDLLPGHARRVELAGVLREGPPFFNGLVAQAEVPPPVESAAAPSGTG